MAFNFEAANMAGYNNPKIEVFEAVLAETGAALTQYPNKDTILNCISRGSIPVILLRVETAGFILPLSDWDTSVNGTTLVFSTIASDPETTKIKITYPENDKESPSVTIK